MGYLKDAYGQYVLGTNPTAFFRMQQPVGQACTDEMGTGALLSPTSIANETIIGGVTPAQIAHRYTAGYWGTQPTWPVTRTWTVAMWARIESTPSNYGTVITIARSGVSAYLSLAVLGSGTYLTRQGAGNIGTGGPAIADGTNWHLWTFCGGVNDTRFYRDATLGLSSGDTYDITANGSGNMLFQVGQANGGYAITDLAYWNRELSATDVANLYAARLKRSAYTDLGSLSGVSV